VGTGTQQNVSAMVRDVLVISFYLRSTFGVGDRTRLRKRTTEETQTLCTMPRDSFGASNIGTFACRTFSRDTKASKRAKISFITIGINSI
jgi:hypothetical protein